MKCKDHNIFIEAIHLKRKLEIYYRPKSPKENPTNTRIIIPLDYGRHYPRKDNRGYDAIGEYYFFYDLSSPRSEHFTPLEGEQIISIKLLNESFILDDYEKLVSLMQNLEQKPWRIIRDTWGKFN